MEKFRNYDVSFSGLDLGSHSFEFEIAQSFFDLFEFEQDFDHPELKINLLLYKRNNFLEIDIRLSGSVGLDCDITNEHYTQILEAHNEFIIKFGEEFDDSDDEVWIIPFGEHSFNVAQLIYEMCLLAVPFKRIHPDVVNGKSRSEMIDLLEKYSPNEAEDSNNEETDPRWEALKKLKSNNN